jgi:peptidoglycan/xylan/chitin deacetylase (PgdA/CDA1 family)
VSGDANKISYSRLAPHRRLFATGLPILTYHHVGARPLGVKWRSLYVSPRLFARQMAELAEAGFRTTTLDAPRPVAGNPERRVGVTFDDGYVDTLEHAAPVLARHGFTAIQFLVADQIGGRNEWDVAEGERPSPLMNEAQVRAWLAAGHAIGSHTCTHPRLTRLTRAAQREELRASRLRLEDRFGVRVDHFCFPYGDADASLGALLEEAGYATACLHLQSGVNLASTPCFELRRLEARYPKRSLRGLWRWFRESLAASSA